MQEDRNVKFGTEGVQNQVISHGWYARTPFD